MSVALCTMAHSPLMWTNDPGVQAAQEVADGFAAARAFIADFDPDVVVLFAPDHYNGFLYDLMPPFCIGYDARSVGDYGTRAGDLRVDRGLADAIVTEAFASDLDVAYSERMVVDHGAAQALELLVGDISARPVVPVFINSVAEPMGPPRRARLLGEAVGRVVSTMDERVLLVGSGGLSHDPPVPRLAEAAPEVAERLIAGHERTPQQRAEHEARVIAGAREFAAGGSALQPLNPDWDRHLMELLAGGDLSEIDTWTTAWCTEQGGHSAHEVRTWIAAYAALGVTGPYDVVDSYYRPIDEWIAGFGITTARPSPVTPG
jgi:2,3-dihydroxyphenylpropionate 1,2-dioxygenase